MFGIRYTKTGPTTYTLLFRNGKLEKEGAGQAFWYYAPTAVLVRVPIETVDVPFAFEDVSADFQAVTIQGQLTYRIRDPKKVASLLDFSVNAAGTYQSNDPRKLNERLISVVQVLCVDQVRRLPLRQLLSSQATLSDALLAGLRDSSQVELLGLEILSLAIVAVRPNPETAKALEAEAREALLREADTAVYARRDAAVQQERTIKESELNTELAVEEKRRQIRQKKMEADIEAEKQRAALLNSRVENDRKAADAQAYALEATLKPLRDTDWRTILAANAAKIDPKTGVALAFRELAENASKIGQLNITPDVMAALSQANDAPKR